MQLANRVRSTAGVRSSGSQRVAQVRPVVSVRTAAESVQVSSNGASAAGTNPVGFEDLSDIIRLVQDTDIVEFELKSKKFNLSVRKREAIAAELAAKAAAAGPVQYVSAPAPVPVAAPAAAPAPAPAAAPAAAPAPKPAAPAPAAAPKGVEVTSPMAGTLYRAAAPGEPAFVKEGDIVKKGQTVCIIEAMKLMNEIEAEVGGEVIKFLIDNGSPVSPGQPILLLKPVN